MPSISQTPDESQGAKPRKAISKRIRYEVLRRDNNTCRYCHATDTPLTLDHVLPTALGGTDDPANLVAACKDCNAGKSSASPDESLVAEVSEDAARWAAAMKLAAERMAANKAEVAAELQPWFDQWFIRSGPGWSYKLPDDADRTLQNYLAAGMPVQVLIDAANVALGARQIDNRFRYFQGVANNMLAELQRDASVFFATPAVEADDYECLACHYRHARNECGWRTGYRIGLVDCSVMHTDTTTGGSGHPDHYAMLALSRVVDRAAHEWAATWEFPSELYPTYTGRAAY